MRLLPVLAAALLVSACKPSEMFGPDSRKDELAGEVITGAFPSGTWEDGLGNAWVITISRDELSGDAGTESIRGLKMVGAISGDTLAYEIGFPNQPAIAHGTARLIDEDHAYFRTLNMDGTLNAHGLLHFNHSAQVPTGQPMDLRPQSDCADQVIKGD